MTDRIPELEAWLDCHQIRWDLTTVAVDDLDTVAGLTNQARPDQPLDTATVERYAADLAAGDQFPPIVVHDTNDGLDPVGGNHRITAARIAGIATLPAYVVHDLTARLEWLLAVEDNRRHGLALTEPQRAHHALRLVDSGTTHADAARAVGLTPGQLQRHLSARRATQRATAAGIDPDAWAALSSTSRARLAAITDDRVFTRAANLTCAGVVRASDVDELVSRLNNTDTPAEAIQHLLDLEKAAAKRTRRPQGRPSGAPRLKLLAQLDAVLGLDPDTVAADTAPAHRRQLADQIDLAVDHLLAIRHAATDDTAKGAA